MWTYIALLAPLVLGMVLGAAIAKGWVSSYALFALGLIAGFGVVLIAYLTSPPDQAHSNGTEGQQFLGRWWDPAFVVVLTAIGYVIYLVGVGIGAFARELALVLRGAKREGTRGSD
jgi:hypothetical protein